MATVETTCLAGLRIAMLRHTKAEKVREDSRLLMQPHANWEEFLMPAPASIAMLGELIAVSAATDFPVGQQDADGWHGLLRHPESFRACLMQVSNQGWKTFNLAHKNMDQIRMHSQSVPEHMSWAVRTLMQGDRESMLRLLPLQLGSIHTVAQECRTLAVQVEGTFLELTDLIHELLEALTSTKGAYEAEVQEVSQRLQEVDRRKLLLEGERKRAEEYFARMTREVEEAHHLYGRTVERAPSEWGVMGMFAVESSINAVGSLVSGFMSMVTADPVSLSATVVESLANVGNIIVEKVRSKGRDPAPVLGSRMLSKSTELMVAATKLQELLSADAELSQEALMDQVSRQPRSEVPHSMLQRLADELTQEEEEESAPTQAALTLCQKGIGICHKLEEMGQGASPSQEQLNAVATRIKEFYSKVLKFSASCASGYTGLPPSAPNLAKASEAQDPEDKSLVQTLMTQARVKIENARAQLESSRQEYQHSFEELKRSNRELDKVLGEMRQCRVTEVDFSSMLRMLGRGLEGLGRVREQWTKLIRFFDMVSNLIEVGLSKSLQMFSSQAQGLQGLEGYGPQQLLGDMIYAQAFQATNISCLVHTISLAYTEISSTILMEQVSRLGTLITLEPSNPAFEAERRKLQEGCDGARRLIMERVESGQERYETHVQQRIRDIDSSLQAALPPASPLEQQAIRSSLAQPAADVFREIYAEEQWA